MKTTGTSMIGKATYTNKVTKQEYKLGFELSPLETELSKAWDMVSYVSRRFGWRKVDIKVEAGK